MKKEKIVKFEPTFENGGFWEYYKDLERQFEDFLTYVPYLQGNKGTYSFRLASLILSTGAYIDSAFKEVAEYADFPAKYPKLYKKIKKGKATIRNYYVLAKHYKLPQGEVIFKCLPERITLFPFEDYTKEGKRVTTPDGWRVYNKVKHEFSDNFQKATLRRARDALAGAFLLNVRHIPGALRLYEYELVKFSHARLDKELFEELLNHEERFKVPCFVETPLFRYNYVENEE